MPSKNKKKKKAKDVRGYATTSQPKPAPAPEPKPAPEPEPEPEVSREAEPDDAPDDWEQDDEGSEGAAPDVAPTPAPAAAAEKQDEEAGAVGNPSPEVEPSPPGAAARVADGPRTFELPPKPVRARPSRPAQACAGSQRSSVKPLLLVCSPQVAGAIVPPRFGDCRRVRLSEVSERLVLQLVGDAALSVEGSAAAGASSLRGWTQRRLRRPVPHYHDLGSFPSLPPELE